MMMMMIMMMRRVTALASNDMFLFFLIRGFILHVTLSDRCAQLHALSVCLPLFN
jgi:hypothetical protein